MRNIKVLHTARYILQCHKRNFVLHALESDATAFLTDPILQEDRATEFGLPAVRDEK